MVAAHGNSLRALVMRLEQMRPEDIVTRNIPTGIPYVYRLDRDCHPIEKRYLADQGELAAAIGRAASHGTTPDS